MEKSNIPEEVTITPVIRDVERLILRLFYFVKSSILYLAKILKKLIKFGVKNFVILAIVTLVGGLIGYSSEQFFPKNYSSSIVVKPSINAKAQLYNDIKFINSLIEKNEVETLSNLLDITAEDAHTLSGIKVGVINSEIEKFRLIDSFYKKLDTASKNNLNIKDLLEEGVDIYGSRFAISIYGTAPTVFAKLEPKFLKFLERVPELQARRKAAIDLLQYQKSFYLKQLSDLDTLKSIINATRIAEAKKIGKVSATSISLGSQQAEESMKVLDIYKNSSVFFNELVIIESDLFDLTTCYKVYSRFSEYGFYEGRGKLERAVIFGGLLFILTFIVLGGINALSSIKKGDA